LVAHIEGENYTEVFENRVLRRIFGSMRDEKIGEWRKLHNKEFNDVYCSPYIFRVILVKSRRMRWVVHVGFMGVRKGVYRDSMGKSEGRDHLEDRGVDGSIILRWIIRKWHVGIWT
jgi:hypothetical protein